MYPLIEIQTVPIEIQMKSTNAKLNYSTKGTAQMEISRDTGGLHIKSRPIQVKIDTFEARNSIVPSTMRSIQQGAQNGQSQILKATAQIAQEGRAMSEAGPGEDVLNQIARSVTNTGLPNINVTFLPDTPPEISFEGGEMNIRYEMDKLNFDWRMQQMDFTFEPADIEFTVTQQPDVIIKYIGGPLYVPPSADPNYVPVDVNA